MADISGTWQEGYGRVVQRLERQLDEGLDVGASVSVVVDGEVVVDIWGGHADEGRTRPWERDTIVNTWSLTKTMTALCALILADRGELDLRSPVARYWPEFAAAGKGAVEVRHLLGHSAGLAGWTEPVGAEDLADWERMTRLLGAQEPWWEPGTQSGYHALTQGYLVGEVVRRITGTTLGRFFAAEVAGPLGADYAIGLPAGDDARVASMISPGRRRLSSSSAPLAARVLGNPRLEGTEPQQVWWRRAEIPAANGQGNARSVARVQAVLACGGEVDGVRLLSPRGCEVVFEEQADGTDLVLGPGFRLGMGYGLASDLIPIGPRACFWGGWGGSMVIVDLEARVVVCYVMNKMAESLVGDTRGGAMALSALRAVGQRPG